MAVANLDGPASATGRHRLAGWRLWLPMLLGLVAALAALEVARRHFMFDPNAAALGQYTSPVFGEVAGRRIHCEDHTDTERCLAPYRAAGRPPAVLWLGNSQLHGINRYVAGQATAPMRLHEALRPRGRYVVTYSQPNANLMEHRLLFEELRRQYDVRVLLLAVCLDDFRATGIRETVGAPAEGAAPAAAAPDRRNAQAITEAALNAALREALPLWRSREYLMGLTSYALYVGRNRLLGIDAQTKRPVPLPLYEERMELLRGIVAKAREAGVKVVLYVPPYRSDVPGPYVEAQYAAFRADLARLAEPGRTTVLDLTDIVPGREWGQLKDPLLGFVDYDFMHFTAEGHRRLADALAPAI